MNTRFSCLIDSSSVTKHSNNSFLNPKPDKGWNSKREQNTEKSETEIVKQNSFLSSKPKTEFNDFRKPNFKQSGENGFLNNRNDRRQTNYVSSHTTKKIIINSFTGEEKVVEVEVEPVYIPGSISQQEPVTNDSNRDTSSLFKNQSVTCWDLIEEAIKNKDQNKGKKGKKKGKKGKKQMINIQDTKKGNIEEFPSLGNKKDTQEEFPGLPLTSKSKELYSQNIDMIKTAPPDKIVKNTTLNISSDTNQTGQKYITQNTSRNSYDTDSNVYSDDDYEHEQEQSEDNYEEEYEEDYDDYYQEYDEYYDKY